MESQSETEGEKISKCIMKIMNIRKLDRNPAACNTQTENVELIDVNLLLDEFISFRVSSIKITSLQLNRLIVHCCGIVPSTNTHLAIKCCRMLTQLLNMAKVDVETASLNLVADYLLRVLAENRLSYWALPDLLKSLDMVLREDKVTRLSPQVLETLLTASNDGILYSLIFPIGGDSQGTTSERLDVIRLAVQCLEVCTSSRQKDDEDAGVDDFYLNQCLTTLISVLKTNLVCPASSENTLSVTYTCCKIVSSALKSFHQIVSMTRQAHLSVVGELLATVRVYMFFGRADVKESVLNAPAVLEPVYVAGDAEDMKTTAVLPPQRPSNASRRPTKTKKSKKSGTASRTPVSGGHSSDPSELVTGSAALTTGGLTWRGLSESESDLSDTETAVGGSRSNTTQLEIYQSRIRQHALLTLHAVIRSTPRKVIFSYWSSFIPSNSESYPSTLGSVISSDKHSKVRLAALVGLSALLEQSKSALLIVSDMSSSSSPSASSSHLPYTPYSVQLADMVCQTHNLLFDQLKCEKSNLLITQLLKVLSVLMANSPYHRLRLGLLSQCIEISQTFLSHRDVNVRVSALSCLGSAVSVHAPLTELISLIKSSPARISSPAASSVHDGSSGCWIIDSCYSCIITARRSNNMSQNPPQLPIRVEALQVISALTASYLFHVRHCLPAVTHLLELALSDSNPTVQLHAAKACESVASALSKLLPASLPPSSESENIDCSETNAAPRSDLSSDSLTVEECLLFWNCMLSGQLISLTQKSNNNQVQAACIDCLASMGATVYSLLTTSQQMVCVTLLLGLVASVADDSPQSATTTPTADFLVQESAIRALGIFVLFPTLRCDSSFIADMFNLLCNGLTRSQPPNIRSKAAWSLANASDTLVLTVTGADGSLRPLPVISDSLLDRLLKVSMSLSNDADKVKYNSMRMLGNLLRCTSPHILEKKDWAGLISRAIEQLISNVNQGVMKVRWNACYALGNCFKNDSLMSHSSTWVDNLFTSLCSAMSSCKNYKVRINACSAIHTADRRYKFGPSLVFAFVFNSTCSSLSQFSGYNPSSSAPVSSDFSNYKYECSLIDSLINLLLHLVSLLELSDLAHLTVATDFIPPTASPSYFDSARYKEGLMAAHVNLAHVRLSITSMSTAGSVVESLSAVGTRSLEQVEDLLKLFSDNPFPNAQPRFNPTYE